MKTKSRKRIWRVICVLGNGSVSGNCGHNHPTSKHAMRCSYEPRSYQDDRDALLLAQPITR